MAALSLATRLARLARQREVLQAQLPHLEPGITSRRRTEELLELLDRTIAVLQQRQVERARVQAAPRQRAVVPARRQVEVIARPPADPPPLPAPATYTQVRTLDAALETVWTPHRDAPPLLGDRMQRYAW